MACAVASGALAGASGAAAPVDWPTTVAIAASTSIHWPASTMAACAGWMAQASASAISCFEVSTLSAAPLRTAWRMRCANSGWSLRRFEPTTKARCSCVSEAIEVPSQRMPSKAVNSALRRR